MDCLSAMDAFLTALPSDGPATASEAGCLAPGWASPCFMTFLNSLGGATFSEGVYCLIKPQEVGRRSAMLAEIFPEHADTACFGSDWLGRHYVISQSYRVSSEPGVLFLDPARGKVIQVPATFRRFHANMLAEQWRGLLDETLYARVRKRSGPATYATCYGYKLPPRLGGDESTDNLELWDAEVYLACIGHALAQAS